MSEQSQEVSVKHETLGHLFAPDYLIQVYPERTSFGEVDKVRASERVTGWIHAFNSTQKAGGTDSGARAFSKGFLGIQVYEALKKDGKKTCNKALIRHLNKTYRASTIEGEAE